LLAAVPGLVLSLAESEEFVGGTFESYLVMEGLDELGEVAMKVSQIERRTSKLVGDHGSGTANGGGVKGSEVSPEGGIRIAVEDIESLEDGVEEVEG
jgi:hypothetical protein